MGTKKYILDYGCGTGGNSKWLAKRGEYKGIDILEENIKKAQEYFPHTFEIYNPQEKIPCDDSSVDELHCYDVLEHVHNFDYTIEEICRVVKKQGRVYVTVPAPCSERALLRLKQNYFQEVGHLRIVDRKKVVSQFEEKGFVCIRYTRMRGVEAFVLWLISFLKKEKPVVEHQTGSPVYSRFIVASIILFDTRLFHTSLRWFFPVYIFTLPIGWCVSKIFPKTQYLIFQRVR